MILFHKRMQLLTMPTIREQIKEIEDEIRDTPYNKATQHHIGKLKAKLARLKSDEEKFRSAGTGVSKGGFGIKKSGNATVALVGFPGVGKSTLLNKLTDAESEVGAYHFTTLSVIPGIMELNDAKVQVLDMPGLIKGASKGRGRGREVIAAARNADLIILMVDIFNYNLPVLLSELNYAGFRLNQRRAKMVIQKRDRGGLEVHSTVKLTKIDEDFIKEIIGTYGHINADIIVRQDISDDQLIDFLSENIIYLPAVVIVNKVDMANKELRDKIREKLKGWPLMMISAERGKGLETLRKRLYNKLDFIRLYMKPQGKKADMNEPLVLKSGSTVGMVCDALHRDFRKKFRYAMVWGKSAKFPGQIVGVEHVLKDQDVLSIIIQK
jgi:ribosome-interacting GTPase 1